MLTTRTGAFPIGFRRGWSDWQKDLTPILDWAKANDLGVVDIGKDGAESIQQVTGAGLKIGSVDLLEWGGLMSPDSTKRADAVAQNSEYVASCAAAGARNFFAVLMPEKADLPRRENFGYAVESLNALASILEANDAHIVIEGYPGPGALACTPEGYRALFNECVSSAIGINYDPSHLLRMRIDPIRFLREFGTRVFHVHGKDTEIIDDNVYEFGVEQPATFAAAPAFGTVNWRYTIPGHGLTPWGEVFRILESNDYAGAVCIELEDANYNGSEDGEKRGLIAGAQHLALC